MRRKLIEQGGGGYTVYLPKDWVQRQELTAGDDVDISDHGDALAIGNPHKRQEEKRITLHLEPLATREETEQHVARTLTAAYKQGATEIAVESESDDILDFIEQRIDALIGIELIEESNHTITLKSLMQEVEMDLDDVLSRSIHITRHITKTLDGIREEDTSTLKNLRRLERTQNKLTDFAKRILAQGSFSEREKYLYAFVMEDERLVDQYKYIIEHYQENNVTLEEKTLELFEAVNGMVHTVLDLVTSEDERAAQQLASDRVTLKKQVRKNLDAGRDVIINAYLQSILIRAYEMGEAILEGELTV